jgi:hypothetical protein
MTIDYKIRSVRLVDLINEIKSRKLILSSYFQRNLVWRLPHKKDFIRTILKGYPFPEIFIAKGELDTENMTSRDCIVDGQQRLNAIEEYLDGKFDVDGKKYNDLSQLEKEEFLKYEIAIVDLDLKHDDPEVIEIFKRLNMLFYSLNTIEKYSTEFAHAEIMLVAKLLSGELFKLKDEDDQDILDEDLKFDPRISNDFLNWAEKINVESVNILLVNTNIFSKYQLARQYHLMYALNILATIKEGIIHRNVTRSMLDNYVDKYEDKEEIIKKLNDVSKKINGMRFPSKSYWSNKANMFTLIIILYNNYEKIKNISSNIIRERLEIFEKELPDDYEIAAREGVNNRGERILRDKYLQAIIDEL